MQICRVHLGRIIC